MTLTFGIGRPSEADTRLAAGQSGRLRAAGKCVTNIGTEVGRWRPPDTRRGAPTGSFEETRCRAARS